MEANEEEQQYCLRWNNFQVNITTQFEALRDDEDFTDVTIACDGQRFLAHKVVLSACSPLFKDLFKSNPCPHPIIFMRDVDARSIHALMEFMYTGEVNVAQAHLTSFLKTAESLKIRGLTDPSSDILHSCDPKVHKEKDFTTNNGNLSNEATQCNNSTVTSSQDIHQNTKKLQRINESTQLDLEDTDVKRLKTFAIDNEPNDIHDTEIPAEAITKQPKVELPEYLSDDDRGDAKFLNDAVSLDIMAGMEILPLQSALSTTYDQHNYVSTRSSRTRKTFKRWSPFEMHLRETSPDLLAQIADGDVQQNSNRLVKLAEGIEIYEEQLRGVKWNDYRKLTRGLATILFSPSELATCSVTGQRWSRAGNDERPVKPALDRAKVQAIISYVASRFPMVEISRIKQVLAYKCKENSTAFKMKAVRYFADQVRESDKK